MDAFQVTEEWRAALADARLSSEDCILRLTDKRPTDEGRGAQWFEPGMRIEPDEHLVAQDLAAELNLPEHANQHRVVVKRPLADDPVAVAAFAGKLRHELEHARQLDACGRPIFQLNMLADWVLSSKIKGLPAGRVFTNLKPIEQDANAASAMFLRKRMPAEAVSSLLEDPADAPLARSLTPPGSLETLTTRMVAFLYLYEDLCEALAANWPFGFAEHLDEISPGAGRLWQTLRAASLG